jgi:hypothetical protein
VIVICLVSSLRSTTRAGVSELAKVPTPITPDTGSFKAKGKPNVAPELKSSVTDIVAGRVIFT